MAGKSGSDAVFLNEERHHVITFDPWFGSQPRGQCLHKMLILADAPHYPLEDLGAQGDGCIEFRVELRIALGVGFCRRLGARSF